MLSIEKAHEIIDENVAIFLKQVAHVTEKSTIDKYSREIPDFEFLRPGSPEFQQSAHYERILEWYIRDLLINPIIQKLLFEMGVDASWPDTEGKVYVCFRNESYENQIPFEFIVQKKTGNIAYRYTGICDYDKDLERILKRYKLSQIVVIDWSQDGKYSDRRRKRHPDERVLSIHVEEAFEKLFGREIAQIVLSKTSDAVQKANEEIGFSTVPKMTLRYLSGFRAKLSEEFRNKDYKTLRYQVINKDNPSLLPLENIALNDDDYFIAYDNFIRKERYKALLGSEGFSKCFYTAEYLYYALKDGNEVDYTSVVCGYLKAIEQLIFRIVYINDDEYSSSIDLWIKCTSHYKKKPEQKDIWWRENPNEKGKPQIKCSERNRRFYDTTLAPLIWFLSDNDRYVLSNKGKDSVHSLLLNYSQECRNDHFHKDNITNFSDVEIIRNDTFLIAFLLLGGVKLTNDEVKNHTMLGIIDDAFDKIYRRLMEISSGACMFWVQFAGEPERKAYRLISQERPRYDRSGSLIESSIVFASSDIFKGYDQEDSITPDIIIDKDHIPEKLWYEGRQGKRVLIFERN